MPRSRPATLRDIDEAPLGLPEVTRDRESGGRPSCAVHGKTFAFGTEPRGDAGPEYPAGVPCCRRRGGAMAGYTGSKDDYLKRLRRIEGQVRGVQKMVDTDTYCIDILTQVSAITKALQAVSLGLLEDHVAHCVVDAARESDESATQKVREASEAIARLVRS